MEIHVSLDIMGGSVVRLVGGDPSRAIVYSSDPLSLGLDLLERGVRRLHIVDLGAAVEGRRISSSVVALAAQLRASGGFVTLGGGVRSEDDVDRILELGIDRVVIGTMAYQKGFPLERILERHGERIVVAADVRGGLVVHSGWTRSSGTLLEEALRGFARRGARLFLVTRADLDGTLRGVDRAFLKQIPRDLRGLVIYSGGVAGRGDLEAIASLGFRGAVIGRAFYEGLLGPEDLAPLEV